MHRHAVDTSELQELICSSGVAVTIPDRSCAGAMGVSVPDANLGKGGAVGKALWRSERQRQFLRI
ncbi:MAG: hypothetical protein J4F49_14300 [Rhodobacteraceae bacterium]|nr:hypothetical protein [Paracoccaceae bacterium]